MLFIDDDINELFRRAAENYPLRADDANWDKVLQQLPVSNKSVKVMSKKAKERIFKQTKSGYLLIVSNLRKWLLR